MRRVACALVGAVAVALLAAGCGGADAPGDAGAGESPSAAAASSSAASEAAPSAASDAATSAVQKTIEQVRDDLRFAAEPLGAELNLPPDPTGQDCRVNGTAFVPEVPGEAAVGKLLGRLRDRGWQGDATAEEVTGDGGAMLEAGDWSLIVGAVATDDVLSAAGDGALGGAALNPENFKAAAGSNKGVLALSGLGKCRS